MEAPSRIALAPYTAPLALVNTKNKNIHTFEAGMFLKTNKTVTQWPKNGGHFCPRMHGIRSIRSNSKGFIAVSMGYLADLVTNGFRSAGSLPRFIGVSPAVAWATCPDESGSCPRAGRERDAPETAGKMPAPRTLSSLYVAIPSRCCTNSWASMDENVKNEG
jgi:hypothetical protein